MKTEDIVQKYDLFVFALVNMYVFTAHTYVITIKLSNIRRFT